MAPEHTKEPWEIGRLSDCIVTQTPDEGTMYRINHDDNLQHYGGYLICESVSDANRRRIVACVNACAGIPTEHLEALGLGGLSKYIDLADDAGLENDLLALPYGVGRTITRLRLQPEQLYRALTFVDTQHEVVRKAREKLDELIAANVVYPERSNEDARRQMRAIFVASNEEASDAQEKLREAETLLQWAERQLKREADRQRALEQEVDLLVGILGYRPRTVPEVAS